MGPGLLPRRAAEIIRCADKAEGLARGAEGVDGEAQVIVASGQDGEEFGVAHGEACTPSADNVNASRATCL